MKRSPTVSRFAIMALAALMAAAGCAAQSGRVPESWPPGPGGTELRPLLEALRSDSEQFEATMALSQIPEPGLINPLVAALSDPDRNYRFAAAAVLVAYLDAPGFLQNEPLFFSAPKPPQGYDRKRYEAEMSAQAAAVRRALTAAFRRALEPGADPVAAALLFGANDYWLDYDWRDVQADKIGREAAGPLSGLLKDGNPDVRGGAAVALGKIGRSDTVEPVIALLNDEDLGVRIKAARALADFGDPRAVRPLIAALKIMEITPQPMRICGNEPDPEWEPAARAAWALGKLKAAEAVDPLIAALKDGDEHFKMCVVEALGRIGDPKAIAPLIALWREGPNDLGPSSFTASVLAGFGQAAVGPLMAAIKEGGDRSDFFYCLEQIGEPAIEPLIALLSDDNEEVRSQAAFTLGDIKSPAVLARLSEVMSSGSPRARLAAVKALGQAEDPKSVALLVAALKDPDAEVREYAIDELRDKHWMARDDQRRRAIDVETLGPLAALAEADPDENVRNVAAWAVEDIKEDRH